ncbi:HD-GYP domain-containing protein [Sporomusa acidovorans]|uniref:HD-GYP domain-containing protein n=1 Tax=Sporomusa acidovorans (strain ATCC 49682 / DSM 3132 / Mol) TaxID=1123286 RepID=A0ABZ3J5Q0_SPOA4|nr:HD domain-containing phosphohydrolase [Sporomusa acidovorans]OZC15665.1 cyclic di-GMP phosphodiesterase response regulator RpfG [Sporomusa acidovorans DSM 3132]SDE88493.1 HD-GYP domain, c-di-GMP phosphodiesterase class II (or its inactivated variant) [Sporomusa acidovorans]
MQRISLEEIKPGMYLSKPLLTADGAVLLHEGIEIKDRYIKYLLHKGITSLYIGEPEIEGTVLEAEEDTYDSQQGQETVTAAREVINQFRVGKGIQLDRVKNIVSGFISQLTQKPENMIHLLDIRRKEEYMFSHAINTCILSVMTGLAQGYDAKQLYEVGLAALLHDVGKIRFSCNLTQQYPKYLSTNSREEYKQHPFYSLEILKKNQAISIDVVNACFQHHERWNGSGYPMGLAGDTISEYAQIVSIADVYDRLIAGMPHRRPTPVYYAAAILNKAAGEYFNPALVEKFNQNVAIYPMGKTVRLNNRQSGLILGVGVKSVNTPVVRIIASEDGSQVNQLVELDLVKNPGLFIVDFEEIYAGHIQAYADYVPAFNPKAMSV